MTKRKNLILNLRMIINRIYLFSVIRLLKQKKIGRYLSLSAISALLILTASCRKNSCFLSKGDMVQEERILEGFKQLTVEDLFTVYYKHDSINKVVVKSGANLIDGILTNVTDSSLVIENTNKCNWMRSFKNRPEVTVYSNNLEKLVMNGESDFISLDTIKTKEFTYEVWAGISTAKVLLNCDCLNLSLNATTGDYNFSGRAGVEYIYSVGNSFVDASNLMSGYSFISSNSTGDIFVSSSKRIDAHLLNSGDIFYYGCPLYVTIVEQISTGSLYHLY